MRARALMAVFGVALLATCLSAVLACGGRGAVPADASQSASGPPPDQASEKGEEEPRVVRWVCTDRLCGGCDGDCSRHGHVATHKGGHCACTPREGSALDRATRKAFEGREKDK